MIYLTKAEVALTWYFQVTRQHITLGVWLSERARVGEMSLLRINDLLQNYILMTKGKRKSPSSHPTMIYLKAAIPAGSQTRVFVFFLYICTRLYKQTDRLKTQSNSRWFKITYFVINVHQSSVFNMVHCVLGSPL